MAYFKRHIFSLLTLLFIAVLSLMPAQEFPQTNVQFADKWVHWVMYAFLTLVMGIECILRSEYIKRRLSTHSKVEYPCKSKGKVLWQLLLIALFSSLFGGLMELGQAYLTTSRHGDWLDVWANSFGALCGLLCLGIYTFSGKD